MKKYRAFIFLTFAAIAAFAYDWPQTVTGDDDFYSYFAQLRGNTVSPSLIFNESSEITSCEEGQLLLVISEHDKDFGWFESPLGNAAVIAHKDNIVSVYANLDEQSLKPLPSYIQKNHLLGTSGGSSWQDGASALELLFFDTKNKNAINPRILLPRTKNEAALALDDLKIISRMGTSYDAKKTKVLPQGFYTLTARRQKTVMPFKTELTLNGIHAERLAFDVLTSSEGKLCVSGNRLYSKEEFFPEENVMLLGSVQLIKGHNEILITVTDILGNRKTERLIFETN